MFLPTFIIFQELKHREICIYTNPCVLIVSDSKEYTACPLQRLNRSNEFAEEITNNCHWPDQGPDTYKVRLKIISILFNYHFSTTNYLSISFKKC